MLLVFLLHQPISVAKDLEVLPCYTGMQAVTQQVIPFNIRPTQRFQQTVVQNQRQLPKHTQQ